MDMKKRVHLELKNRSPAQVCVLALDTCRSGDGEVDGVTEEFSGLEVLRMGNVGLKSLSKLPSLPKLHKLDLSGNGICGGLEALAQKCPNLTHLNISGNKIGDMAALEALEPLKKLKTLYVSSCEVSAQDDYRKAVFRLLPNITYLDGYDRHDNEAPDSDDDERDGAGPHSGEDDEDEEEVGLSYLMKEGIQDEDDDGEYVEEEEEEEEEEDEDGEDEVHRGDKRKRDEEEDEDADEDDK
ncbi:acidic leucine-rich nuclear phosphoprotein 32 family member E-like isoform X2 [Syngnathus typhle]|uniref:acidic leucine-rich nuclear phosphoprotein 32 family member E-like isoform X2 n=1 Tax=Syngnathus typhle TaxID=161592 RepID=UPI002A69BDB2|nr:acidic leucine-rich nuclear phosphoprotein 32 family member E-like isoform X2 [Syngnathus typhle]